jgi:drug/metabolite transporter (DMT)-like permease
LLGLLMLGAMSLLAHFEPQYTLGLLLGLISGLAAALFTIFNGQFTTSNPPLFITFFEMIGAAIFTAIFTCWFVYMGFEPLQYSPNINNNEYAWYTDAANLFFLAIICTVYAYATSVELLRRIPAFVVNLSVNLEPVYGIVLAAFIFEEWYMLSIEFYICASLIISAVLVHPFLANWEQKWRKSC